MVEDILIVVLASLIFLCFTPFDAPSAQTGEVSRTRSKGGEKMASRKSEVVAVLAFTARFRCEAESR
jgi:hypothetical protein